VTPTIWTGLPETATVVQEEIFGPCVHVQPFDTETEAVNMANDTKYGLATTVWTTNLARAHRVAAKIDVGICWINSWFLRDLRTAFGGSKDSGIGREGGVHSLEFYTELRNVCVKLDAEKDTPVERREATRRRITSRARKPSEPEMTGGVVAAALVAHVLTLGRRRTRLITSRRWCRPSARWARRCARRCARTCG
jgi:delta 1-pyrroline-5-carboxylate dehydrogenase